MIRPRLLLAVPLLAMAPLMGCQQSMTSRLSGDWVGRPDTASAAAARSEKLKAQQTSTVDETDLPSEDAAAAELGKTDLEQHNLTIRMTLAADKVATLSLGDGSQPRKGVWRVITTLPPDGAEIEISLDQPEGEPTSGAAAGDEKRRFIIDFHENSEASGFTLVEKGADPQFGRLYFTREDSGARSQGSGD